MTAEQLIKAILEDREATKDEEGKIREAAQREKAMRWKYTETKERRMSVRWSAKTVVFKRFTWGLVRILEVLVAITRAFPEWFTDGQLDITSANDSTHSKVPLSRHYTNEALDVRSHDLAEDVKDRFLIALSRMLGPGFMVQIEFRGGPNEHIHIQVARGWSFEE